MAQPQSGSKAKVPARRPHASGKYVFVVKDGPKGITLPAGASWAVVPDTTSAAARLKDLNPDRVAPIGRVFPTKGQAGAAARASAGGEAVAEGDPDAFAPDARGRAILRGIEYARADLRDAGGAYDIEQVRALLHGISRQAVDRKIREGALLAVPGPSNRRRFPTVQFNSDGSLVPGLKDVQAALAYASPWAVLNFLVNPHDGLRGEKPIDLLRRGEVARVVDAAERVGVQGA